MYKAFYGLTRNPFEITPDPRFFCGTARHNEGLAILHYGIERRKGFIVITGEVGTGKTLLARCLFEGLRRSEIPFGYIFNPLLPALEFLQYAASDMGVPLTGRTKSELLADLNRFLIAQFHRKSTAALIVDEAQLLGWDLLEEVRLLTNLETSQHKLLQIVLIGQPELDEKLESQNLRQLKQRIALRARLQPLSFAETRKYISLRLLLAGANKREKNLFSDPAIERIHQYANGIPRLINTLCDSALIAAFAMKANEVSPELVDEAATDFRLATRAVAV